MADEDRERGLLNEQRIAAHEAQNLERWQAHLSVHAEEKAARVAAFSEQQRRLDILNHAHEEAVRVQNSYVPREVFDASQQEVTRRQESVASLVAAARTETLESQGAMIPRAEAEARLAAMASQVDALRTQLERSAYVPRELFDNFTKEQNAAHARIFDQLSVTYSDISRMKGRSAANAVAVGIAATLLSIIVSVMVRIL